MDRGRVPVVLASVSCVGPHSTSGSESITINALTSVRASADGIITPALRPERTKGSPQTVCPHESLPTRIQAKPQPTHAKPCQANSRQVKPCQLTSSQLTPTHANRSQAMPNQANSRQANPHQDNSSQAGSSLTRFTWMSAGDVLGRTGAMRHVVLRVHSGSCV